MPAAIEKKRNVALLGHGGSGKTSLAEALLFYAGVTSRLGSVEEGNTVSDFQPEEISRRYSIYSTLLPFDYKDHRFTIIDCPGYLDFIGEAIGALSVVDSAVIVVNGVAGVEPQTRQAWEYCNAMDVPRCIFISQLDKENANYEKVLGELREAFGKSVAPFVIPVGQQKDLRAVINVLNRKAYVRRDGKVVEEDCPPEMAAEVERIRTNTIESIVELDEEMLERYMVDDPISEEELLKTLLKGTLTASICPVICGSAKQNIGIGRLLDLIITSMPDPSFHRVAEGRTPADASDNRAISDSAPFSARVFKQTSEGQLGEVTWMRIQSGTLKPGDSVFNPRTSELEKISNLLVMRGKTREDVNQAGAGDIVATVKLKGTKLGDTLCTKESQIIYAQPVYPTAVSYELVSVDDKNDLEKCIHHLHHYTAMDNTLNLVQDDETKELVLFGMGPLHLDVAASYIKSKTGVAVHYSKPRIPYRETITTKAEAQGKFKKQTGGRGKYGDAHVRVEPRERGGGFQFVDAVVGGVVPKNFIPAVEKGILEALNAGPLSGSRVIDLTASLFFGSYHPVDSDELSFKTAGAMGFRAAFEKASPIILEPIYELTVYTPDKYMGDVMGDLNSRRGRVSGMDQAGGLKMIVAMVPLAELYRYINHLRSMTQGQGSYAMKFSNYEQVPGNVQQEITKHYQATRVASADD